jgi:hypothetical protein
MTSKDGGGGVQHQQQQPRTAATKSSVGEVGEVSGSQEDRGGEAGNGLEAPLPNHRPWTASAAESTGQRSQTTGALSRRLPSWFDDDEDDAMAGVKAAGVVMIDDGKVVGGGGVTLPDAGGLIDGGG